MILQSLFRRYENLANEGKLPLKGWGNEKVSFGLRLNEDGGIIDVIDLRTEEVNGKKKFLKPKEIRVPERIKRSSIKSNFLCDNSSYILGIDNNGTTAKSLQSFEVAKEKHLTMLKDCNSKTANSIKNFFNSWNPNNINECTILINYLNEIVKSSNLIFIFEDKYATEDEDIIRLWNNYLNDVQSDVKMQCLIWKLLRDFTLVLKGLEARKFQAQTLFHLILWHLNLMEKRTRKG